MEAAAAGGGGGGGGGGVDLRASPPICSPNCRYSKVTVVGDAAHPMSPFKGDGGGGGGGGNGDRDDDNIPFAFTITTTAARDM